VVPTSAVFRRTLEHENLLLAKAKIGRSSLAEPLEVTVLIARQRSIGTAIAARRAISTTLRLSLTRIRREADAGDGLRYTRPNRRPGGLLRLEVGAQEPVAVAIVAVPEATIDASRPVGRE
jgi:hypothetical protein